MSTVLKNVNYIEWLILKWLPGNWQQEREEEANQASYSNVEGITFGLLIGHSDAVNEASVVLVRIEEEYGEANKHRNRRNEKKDVRDNCTNSNTRCAENEAERDESGDESN